MNRSSEPDEFLTVAEVADTLKLNQQTVRNWIVQGALPAVRVGRRVRIKRSDFQRILDESYSGGSAEASRPGGLSADDFWGGEPVDLAEAPGAPEAPPGTPEVAGAPEAPPGAPEVTGAPAGEGSDAS